MTVLAMPGVDSVPASAWTDMVDRQQLFESRLWLRSNESTFIGEPLITVETDGGNARSIIVWRIMDADTPTPYHNVVALYNRWTDEPAPISSGWTLNCSGSGMHSPVRTAPGVVFTADRMTAHLRAAIESRGTDPAAIGFNFVGPLTHVEGLGEALGSLGFGELTGYTRAVLELPGESYHDYLGGLRSKERKNANNDRRRFAGSGQRISCATGPDAAGEDVIQLQADNLAKYGLPFDPEPQRRRVLDLLTAYGDDGLVIRSHQDGTTTGFATFFRCGTTLHAMFAGFRPADRGDGSYFECVFHSAIEWCYRHGVTEIDYGLSSTAPTRLAKAGRGCRIESVSSWYRFGDLDVAAPR